MKPSWMSDARQIPDEVMTFLRQIAVCAIKEKNFHVDDVSEMLVPQDESARTMSS